MVADSALLIEQLAANAWPAATVQLVDGWLLRYTPGVARRRSNSALPSPGATCASPAQRAQVLDLTERFYARRRQPTAVQVSPAELHDQLDGELAARCYRRQAPTLVLTAPIHRVPVRAPTTSAVAVSIADAVTAQWLAAWTAIEARPDAAATNQQILAGSVRKPATSPRSTTATWSAWGWWWSSGVGPGCSAWPPDPPTAVAGWPTPCSSTRPVGLPIKESTSSTFRSRRTTSPPCGSTAGSASSRPTAITTAWRRPDRPRFRRRITSVVSEAVLDLGLDGPAHGCRPWRLPAERGRRPPTGPALNSYRKFSRLPPASRVLARVLLASSISADGSRCLD
jgi:hypothetical protein